MRGVMNPALTVRRLNLVAIDVVDESNEGFDLFTDVQKRRRNS